MPAGNGLMYTAKLQAVTLTSAPQNIWEILAAAATSLLIHSIRIELIPTIVSGVAQDLRGQIAIQTLTTTGSGGTAVTPVAEHPRNAVAASTVFNSLVTTPGSVGAVQSAYLPSVLIPFDRTFTSDQRRLITGGGRLAVNLAAALGIPLTLSSEIYFEEL